MPRARAIVSSNHSHIPGSRSGLAKGRGRAVKGVLSSQLCIMNCAVK
jgi:hypothetical protein